MIYRVLADAVVVLHLIFILFGLFGGFAIIWRKWMLVIHLPTAVWISVIEFKGWGCPLTPLEKWFREASGEAGYSGGFIEHYLIPIIYPSGLTPEIQIALGVIALTVNLLVYSFIIYRWRKRGSRNGLR